MIYNTGAGMSDLMRQYQSTVKPAQGWQMPAGTTSEDALGWVNQPYKWRSKKKWAKNYTSWADFWKRMTQQSLGLAGREAVDPLAALQNQLSQTAQESADIESLTPQGISKQLGSRNVGFSAQLQQRAAGMGMPGLYQGAMTAQDRVRNTLTDQAWAAYLPQEYQRRKTYDDQITQLVSAIAQAKFEQEKLTRMG